MFNWILDFSAMSRKTLNYITVRDVAPCLLLVDCLIGAVFEPEEGGITFL
jgi:hypothetical protein